MREIEGLCLVMYPIRYDLYPLNMQCIVLLLLLSLAFAPRWGFYAHEEINYLAVFTLPPDLFGFYKANSAYIRNSASNADKRRMVVEGEAMRHYLDVDQYERALPLDTIQLTWDSACKVYGQEHIEEHGIAPWNILRLKYALTKAFEMKDVSGILRLSSDLGHYIADIHVPLHANSNYDGQKTGQHGIHALWESRLPELFLPDYRLLSGRAEYIENLPPRIWQVIGESFALSNWVLTKERELREEMGEGNVFRTEIRNDKPFRTYSLQFRKRYHKSLDNMVERRMRESIHLIGSIWFTAWVDAGQPELPTFTYGSDRVQPEATDSLAAKRLIPIRGRIFNKACSEQEG